MVGVPSANVHPGTSKPESSQSKSLGYREGVGGEMNLPLKKVFKLSLFLHYPYLNLLVNLFTDLVNLG